MYQQPVSYLLSINALPNHNLAFMSSETILGRFSYIGEQACLASQAPASSTSFELVGQVRLRAFRHTSLGVFPCA